MNFLFRWAGVHKDESDNMVRVGIMYRWRAGLSEIKRRI